MSDLVTNQAADLVSDDPRKGLPSASSMDAMVRCLGRRALCAKVPKKPGSKWAERGTRIHNVMDGSDPSALSKSEQTTAYIMQGEEDRIMEDDRYDFIGNSEVYREKRLWAQSEFGEDIYSGQIDALYVQEARERVAVVDYKSGFMTTVPIMRNFQIKTQMALAVIHYKPKFAIASIIHPFHPDSMSETMVFGETELNLLPGIIQSYLDQMTDDAPRTPNPISCQFCDARALCPEYQQSTAALIPISGGGKPVKARWELFTPEQRGERLDLFKMAELVIKDEREAYEELLKKDEGAIPGWKLQSSGKTTTIVDQEKARDIVREALGPDAADGVMEVSGTLLTEHYIASGMTKTAAKEKAHQVLAMVLVFKAKKKSLVRD